MVLTNIFDFVTIFKPHSDFARHLEKIDERRYCSGADDGTVVILDTHVGLPSTRSILHILNGHTRPIACMHAKAVYVHETRIDPKRKMMKWLLVTSSSDHQIILWDVDDGKKFKVYSGEERLARVLMSLPLYPDYFFSGGERLIAWHIGRGVQDSCKPNDNEDISFMLSIRDQYILTAVDNYVVVTEILKRTCPKTADHDENCSFIPSFNLDNQLRLTSHRESITALNKIDDNCFLTGCLDGSIYQWSVNNDWSPVHRYNYVDSYLGDMRIYPYSVQSIIVVKQFIIAGHGNGINVYDALTKRMVSHKTAAHDSKITHLSTVYQGHLFASCSEDATIKIWRLSRRRDASTANDTSLHQSLKSGEVVIESMGTCSLHSASVMKCIAVEPDKFLSCSNDYQVVLWMDSFTENQRICRKLKSVMPYKFDP